MTGVSPLSSNLGHESSAESPDPPVRSTFIVFAPTSSFLRRAIGVLHAGPFCPRGSRTVRAPRPDPNEGGTGSPAGRTRPAKSRIFEPVPPRASPATPIVEATFEVGRRFRCTLRVECGQLDPGRRRRSGRSPGGSSTRACRSASTAEERAGFGSAGRDAVYQLAALTHRLRASRLPISVERSALPSGPLPLPRPARSTRPRADRRTAPSRPRRGRVRAAVPAHAGPDRPEIIARGARPDGLAAQLLHAGADSRKVVGGARLGHVSSDFCRPGVSYLVAATGSIKPGSLIRALPGYALIPAGLPQRCSRRHSDGSSERPDPESRTLGARRLFLGPRTGRRCPGASRRPSRAARWRRLISPLSVRHTETMRPLVSSRMTAALSRPHS